MDQELRHGLYLVACKSIRVLPKTKHKEALPKGFYHLKTKTTRWERGRSRDLSFVNVNIFFMIA